MPPMSAPDSKGPSRPPILVVDDDGDIRLALEMILQYEGFEAWTARDGQEALDRLESEAAAGRRPALVITDLKMPRLDGLGLLRELQSSGGPPVILISGHADVPLAVEAMQKGAVHLLEKPLDEQRVLLTLRTALREEKLVTENAGLRRQLEDDWRLVGESEPMQHLATQLERVSPSEASVLITGENGSGKEVVARNLHLRSPRAAGPFVTVNCAAIPHELIESELFGHEKGSFTGAHERRTGHFESASGGTLFLDEIGDMPLDAQAKVLRALETREITRVGHSSSIPVDIRIVAATNADLAGAVEQQTFRMDLFYRLNVVPLRVPALRERAGDIPALSRHFLERMAARTGRAALSITPEALQRLAGLEWPGNVRQLRNLLEAASVFADGNSIELQQVEDVIAAGPSMTTAATPSGASSGDGPDPFDSETFEEFKNASEALFIQRRLAENDGNVKRTAERLGMQRSHLYKKLDRYGLR